MADCTRTLVDDFDDFEQQTRASLFVSAENAQSRSALFLSKASMQIQKGSMVLRRLRTVASCPAALRHLQRDDLGWLELIQGMGNAALRSRRIKTNGAGPLCIEAACAQLDVARYIVGERGAAIKTKDVYYYTRNPKHTKPTTATSNKTNSKNANEPHFAYNTIQSIQAT
jgi:hypothetical protein